MSLWGLAAILTRVAWVGGFTLSAVVGILWFFQEKLVFYPGVPKGYETPDKNPKGLHHPGERNLPYEDVYIRTRDGITLHGWILRQPNAKHVPTFLYFHGNAGNIGFRLPNLELMFRAVGVNILIVSYRGYGYSEGSPTEEGVYTDAEAALDFILEETTVNRKDIFVFGRSIGGAVAIELARRRGDEEATSLADKAGPFHSCIFVSSYVEYVFVAVTLQLRGVVVENAFTSLLEMLYIVFPFLSPFNLLVKAVQVGTTVNPSILVGHDKAVAMSFYDQEKRLGDLSILVIKWRIRLNEEGKKQLQLGRMYMLNEEKIRSLTLPVLFISGRQDKLVPPSHMDLLFSACGARLKLREDVENGGHNDTWEVGGQSYYSKLRTFVEAALAEAAVSSGESNRQSCSLSTISDASTNVSRRQLKTCTVEQDVKSLE
ncbi:phospholipase carboxylesterase domain-containing protein [Cyclospora cayetanensis]|uniref:Phospholipase carboxylesterase domain-containing protein n=1 Tax=Cyclospora cayetanensis TaxID=88456 RepID=A0A1D3D722_9EIME|nr:phospholipase carboxylesterase domain-containing protein [Cyclospora cayetanensis]